MLSDSCQCRRGAYPLRPVRAADETTLGCLHHVLDSNDRSHRITVADRLGENCNIRCYIVQEVNASGVQSPPSRYLIENQDSPDLCRYLLDSLEKTGLGFMISHRLHNNCRQFIPII